MKMLSGYKVTPAFDEIIDGATHTLVIVTPYFEPWTHVTDSLFQKLDRKIQMFILLRDGEDRAKSENCAAPFAKRGAHVQFLERLHAKIYFSERQALLTSMNFIRASRDSWEVGTLFDAVEDAASYQEIVKMAAGLSQKARSAGSQERSMPEAPRVGGSYRTTLGHCIRCSASIDPAPSRPYCLNCYSSWAEWQNRDYLEQVCHLCGLQWSSSMDKPLCRPCWERRT